MTFAEELAIKKDEIHILRKKITELYQLIAHLQALSVVSVLATPRTAGSGSGAILDSYGRIRLPDVIFQLA